MSRKQQMTVDRESLRMWADGILLDFKMGKGRVCNETTVERAVAAMDAGEIVLLTTKGRIVSQCRAVDDAYVEEPIPEED